MSLPTGEGDATWGSVDPSVGLLWSRDLTGSIGAFGTVIVSAPTGGDDDRLAQLGAAAGVGFPIGGRFDGHVDHFSVFAGRSRASDNLDGGVTHLVGEDVQLDGFARVGLSDAAGDHGLGAGVSARF